MDSQDNNKIPIFKDVKLLVEDTKLQHTFWDTQPVFPVLKEGNPFDLVNEPYESKIIEKYKYPNTPYPLPKEYEWFDLDLETEKDINDVHKLLTLHYIEDDDNTFRINYSVPFLRWSLMPSPGWRKDWHIGVRSVDNKILVAFITAVPVLINIYGKQVKMAEISFLCVHKKLREKGLAPLMIKEVTRRISFSDIRQAVYAGVRVLPNALASSRYWHRPLNIRKLVDIGFTSVPLNSNMSQQIRIYKLPKEPLTSGLRPLKKRDIPTACSLLNKYLQKFHLSQTFTEEKFAHWFLPRDKVIYSFVLEGKGGEITDFISFYNFSYSILRHPKYKMLRIAESFYNVATSLSFQDLMRDMLILANKYNFDMVNILDIMDNKTIFRPLIFKPGNATIQYYLFNWKCNMTNPEGIGLVLI